MSSVRRPAPLALKAVLGNAPPSRVPDGAQAPSLPRVQNGFVNAEKWNREGCISAIKRVCNKENYDHEVFCLVLQTYRAWQLVHSVMPSPDEALRLVSKVFDRDLMPNERVTGEVPPNPPPFGYNGCHGCWDNLDNEAKWRAWLRFWIAAGQLSIPENRENGAGGGGGGGGGAVDDGAAAVE